MAGSRLQRIGTIFERTTGLLQSEALAWEDRPLWYDVYKAFPPKEEPRYDRAVPNMKIKQIFYTEDNIRAQFHKNNKFLGTINMLNNSKTLTQKFIDTYKKLEIQHMSAGDELYQEAVELLKMQEEFRRDQWKKDKDSENISTAFQEAKSQQDENQEAPKININVTDIFK